MIKYVKETVEVAHLYCDTCNVEIDINGKLERSSEYVCRGCTEHVCTEHEFKIGSGNGNVSFCKKCFERLSKEIEPCTNCGSSFEKLGLHYNNISNRFYIHCEQCANVVWQYEDLEGNTRTCVDAWNEKQRTYKGFCYNCNLLVGPVKIETASNSGGTFSPDWSTYEKDTFICSKYKKVLNKHNKHVLEKCLDCEKE